MNDLPENAHIDAEEIWCQVFASAARFSSQRPALFLDRDGVIVEEVHYLHKIQDVALIEGAAEVIKRANDNDIPVIVVTNQSGIARDMFTWQEFSDVQNEMIWQLENQTGAFVDAVFACPHHKTGIAPYAHPDHPARKPNPGMLLRAQKNIPIDMAQSWIVGDRANDLMAGRNASIMGGLHVLTGHGSDDGETEKARNVASPEFTVKMGASIKDAHQFPLFDFT